MIAIGVHPNAPTEERRYHPVQFRTLQHQVPDAPLIIHRRPVYTTGQIGDMLRVDRTTVESWIRKGWLAAFRMPTGPAGLRHIRVRFADLMMFLGSYADSKQYVFGLIPKYGERAVRSENETESRGDMRRQSDRMRYRKDKLKRAGTATTAQPHTPPAGQRRANVVPMVGDPTPAEIRAAVNELRREKGLPEV